MNFAFMTESWERKHLLWEFRFISHPRICSYAVVLRLEGAGVTPPGAAHVPREKQNGPTYKNLY